MEKYNYREEMKKDIREYINNEIDIESYWSEEDAFDDLNNRLWTEDSVTGNASGSYFFSRWKAEKAICHNLDLFQDACMEFGCDASRWPDAEYVDVTIRCYLLGECLSEVLEEMIPNE